MTQISQKRFREQLIRYLTTFLFAGAVTAFLIYFSYDLFQNAVDVFIIITCYVIFIISINTYPVSGNRFFLFLGISYQFVGLFFLLHFLFDTTFGMLSKTYFGISLKTYLIAKTWEAVALGIAPVFFFIRFSKNLWLAIEIAICAFVILYIFNVRLISNQLILSMGTHRFEIYSMTVTTVILAVGLAITLLFRKQYQKDIFPLVILAFVSKILSGLIIILAPQDNRALAIFQNFLVFFSFMILYQALISENLRKPYENLFSELKLVNEKIKLKSADIENSNIRLQKEVEDRKLVEKILLQTKAQLKAILDNIPYLAWLKDRESRFIEVNKPFADSTGKRPEELVGKTDFDVWPKKLAQKYREDDYEVMKMKKSKLTEEPIAERSGIRWFETYKTPIFNKEGEVIGTTGMSRDITERMEASEKIRHSLREKEVLLKEVHHRVKNNLQVISSLLNLQSGYIRDRKVRDFFLETQNRIHSMALVHEKLYQAEDLAHIDYERYIRNLVDHLSSSYTNGMTSVHFELDMENALLNIDTAIQTGLIVNELVSNSLKHAFTRRKTGEIRISFHTEEGRHILMISDDGTGMSGAQTPEDHQTLGLQLVTALVSQLDGTMELKNDNGTAYIITFPVRKDEKKRLTGTKSRRKPARKKPSIK